MEREVLVTVTPAPELEPEDLFSFLEPDIVYPISHVVVRIIEPLGTCVFVLRGYYGSGNYKSDPTFSWKKNTMHSIEIRQLDGAFHQTLDGFSTEIETRHDDYGLEFADWNFDGITDIRLRHWEGGSMRNEPSLFWLWDDERQMFVENKQLMDISETAAPFVVSKPENRIGAYTRGGYDSYWDLYYEYQNGEFVEVEYVSNKFIFEENGDCYLVTQISKPIDGEMQLVEETREKMELAENATKQTGKACLLCSIRVRTQVALTFYAC